MRVELQLLGRTVKQAQHRQHRVLESALNEVGTTLAQWDALRAIQRTPGASARVLAEATFQTEQAFGALASRLEAQQLVDRRPGRGRTIEHHLTPRGEQVLSAATGVADEVLAEHYSALSEPDRATLLTLLERLLTTRPR